VASTGRPVAGVVGLVLHGLTAVFPYAASGLLAPLYGYVLVYLVWAALLVLAVRWFRAGREPLVLVVPGLSLVGWAAVMTFGDFVLGWTA
jgi:hypothetical protein